MTAAVNLTLLEAGYCTQSEYISLRGRHRTIKFPATFALIEHPRLGLMLFDTGYSLRFFEETRRFPYSLYAKATPAYLAEHETAEQRLRARGISPSDVRYVIISHFHADHVGGLRDFSQATFVYFREAYAAVRNRRGLRAVMAAFLPGHIPADFEARSQPVDASDLRPLSADYAPFERGVDLFGDGRLLAVSLPGHAHGQMGLFLTTTDGQRYFLVADGCWHSRAYREHRLPHPLVRLFFADWSAYRHSFSRIHQFHLAHPHVHIIPTHCREAQEFFSD